MLLFNRINKVRRNKILSSLYSIINSRKIIIFDACTSFHLKHFVLVINEFIEKNDFDIYVIGEQGVVGLSSKVNFIIDQSELPLHRKAVAFITTEYYRTIYWLSCPNIYFGHGMGPKLDYVGSDELRVFDYIFSPCKPIYDIQKKFLKKDAKIIKMGLPILEEEALSKNTITKDINIGSDNKTILYAPGWCSNIEMVSDISDIVSYLHRLATTSKINIIISPHPLLFDRDRCSGKSFFDLVRDTENIYINEPDNAYSTLDLVRISDVIISDISSIMFEAMCLNKIVIFDGNRKIYEYSKSLFWYDLVSKFGDIPEWKNKMDNTVLNVLSHDKHAEARNKFINNYAYNISNSKDIFIKTIYDIAYGEK